MISSFQFLIVNFIAFMLSSNMPKVIYYNSNLGESLLNERHYLIGKYAKINNIHSRGDTVLLFNCQTFFYYMSFYLMYLSFVIINKLIDSIIMKGRTINMNKFLDSIILKRPSITMNDTYYIDTECDKGSCEVEDTFAEGTFAEGTFGGGGGGGGGSAEGTFGECGEECGEDCEECWEDDDAEGTCGAEDTCGGEEGSGDKEDKEDNRGSRGSRGCGDEDCECNNTDNSNKCCDCVDEKCSYFCIDSECKIKCLKLD
jgi:hypothetical protein